MKLKDVASRGKVNASDLESWLRETGSHSQWVKYGFVSMNITNITDNADIDLIINDFKTYQAQKAAAAAQAQEEARKKQQALASMLISSGFSFDGYTIVKYSGYISGDDAVQIPRTGWFGGSQTDQLLTDALVRIRRQAIAELKEAAYNLGCNAVVGVDFDYITMDPQTANSSGGTTYEPYVICVTANGNAVLIEKNK